MHTAYYPHNLETETQIALSDEESWHLAKVVRIGVDDEIRVLNGQGQIAVGKVLSNHEQKTIVEISNVRNFPKPERFLHLAVAPTKVADRLEWMIEKTVELGLCEFTPLITERTERKKINTKRLQKIALAACKQSKNPWLPKINEAISFNKFIESELLNVRYIAHCKPKAERLKFKDEASKQSRACLLIGPEGDFSEQEIELALNKGFKSVYLAPYTLRTETAGLYAQAIWM